MYAGYEKDVFAFFAGRVELSLIKHHKYIYVIKYKNNISIKHIIHINLRLFYHIIIMVILMDIDFIISKLIDDTNYAKLLIKYENLTDIDK